MKILQRAFLTLVLSLLFGAEAFAQVITSITPNPVTTGTSLTINGSGFGTSQGLSNTITFAGVPSLPRVVATTWSSGRIVVTVPSSAVSGNVVVTVVGHASNGVNLAVTPQITSVTPASALAGTAVTINGSGFGNSASVGSSTVTFNGQAATTNSWSSTTIVAVVPSGATAGPVVVTVAGQASSSGAFTPVPAISGLTPAQGASGSSVSIAGSSFGNAQGSNVVTFNGVTAPVTAWSNTNITATVPSNTSTGPVTVAVNGIAGSGVNFTVTPGIIGVSPNPGLAGSPVTISGTNFGATQGGSTVTFNGVSGAVTSWNNTSITATVPNNVVAGPVVVTVNGYASNAVSWALTPSYSYSVAYAPNGSVLSAQDSVNGNWTYSYDDFSRLATSSNSNPQQGFSYRYDRYGNRWQQNVTAGTGNSSQLTFSGGPTTSNGNCYHGAGQTNQPDGYCYDAAGNLLNDGQHTYTYDAENRIVSVDGGQAATYVYDGDGLRIEKITASGTADYVYDLVGRVITEVNASGSWTRSEIYAGGRHLATYRNGTTYFIQADWLGTERVRVLPSGDPYEICSNLPFGDGLNCIGASDPSPNHLTGKPRDFETGLDYFGARYYASALGRWISPDWAAKPTAVPYAVFGNPQSLNLYDYVGNNPSNIDPDGHQQCNACRVNAPPKTFSPTPAGPFIVDHFTEPKTYTIGGNHFVLHNGVVLGMVGEHYTQRQLNWMGGCPLSTCHTLNGLFPPLKPVYMTTVSQQVPIMLLQTVPTLGAMADMLMAERAALNIAKMLPAYNGKTTVGILVTNEGQIVRLESGAAPAAYKNYIAASHVEGKAAIYLRQTGSSGGTLYINNTNGICGYCNTSVRTLLPEGVTMEVIPPENAVPNNSKAVAQPTTYTGNANTPKNPN